MQTAAETDFHRSRRAFVILERGILLAVAGFAGSHVDLLRESGFVESQARALIDRCPRGYALAGDVFFYQGADFATLTPENRQKARAWLDFFKQNGLLTGGAFDGMKTGIVGQSWIPVRPL